MWGQMDMRKHTKHIIPRNQGKLLTWIQMEGQFAGHSKENA